MKKQQVLTSSFAKERDKCLKNIWNIKPQNQNYIT